MTLVQVVRSGHSVQFVPDLKSRLQTLRAQTENGRRDCQLTRLRAERDTAISDYEGAHQKTAGDITAANEMNAILADALDESDSTLQYYKTSRAAFIRLLGRAFQQRLNFQSTNSEMRQRLRGMKLSCSCRSR